MRAAITQLVVIVQCFGALKGSTAEDGRTRISRFLSRSSRWRPFIVAPIVLTFAACGGGGNGGVSAPGPSGSLTFVSCTVPDGEASCPGSISWTTSNAVVPHLTVDGVTLSEEASGTINLDLPGDFIDVVLADGRRGIFPTM